MKETNEQESEQHMVTELTSFVTEIVCIFLFAICYHVIYIYILYCHISFRKKYNKIQNMNKQISNKVTHLNENYY